MKIKLLFLLFPCIFAGCTDYHARAIEEANKKLSVDQAECHSKYPEQIGNYKNLADCLDIAQAKNAAVDTDFYSLAADYAHIRDEAASRADSGEITKSQFDADVDKQSLLARAKWQAQMAAEARRENERRQQINNEAAARIFSRPVIQPVQMTMPQLTMPQQCYSNRIGDTISTRCY